MNKNDKIVRWGFVGAGPITDAVAAQASSLDSVVLEAIQGRNHEKVESLLKRHGFKRSYCDFADLLSDSDVDAVYIALPHSLHVDAVLAAVKAGKHVLCEKPLGMNRDEVEKVVVPASGMVVAEAFMIRHHPQWRWIERKLREGALGEIKHLLWSMSLHFPRPEHSPRLKGEGSILLDVGCYPVHMARMIFGSEPLRVSATTDVNDDGRDERFSAQFQFATGTAQIMVDAHLPFASTVRVIGTQGRIDVLNPIHPDEDGHSVVEFEFANEPSGRKLFSNEPQYGLQFADMAEAIYGSHKPLVDLGSALANAICLDAIRMSARDSGNLIAI